MTGLYSKKKILLKNKETCDFKTYMYGKKSRNQEESSGRSRALFLFSLWARLNNTVQLSVLHCSLLLFSISLIFGLKTYQLTMYRVFLFFRCHFLSSDLISCHQISFPLIRSISFPVTRSHFLSSYISLTHQYI
jgi:hypothetical protein